MTKNKSNRWRRSAVMLWIVATMLAAITLWAPPSASQALAHFQATPIVVIDDLSKATLAENKSYRLKEGIHKISKSVRVPSNCTIDARSATVLFEGPNWNAVWDFSNVESSSVVGGKYRIGQWNFLANFSKANGCSVSLGTVLGSTSSDPKVFPGGLATIRGSTSITLSDCAASTIHRYFVYVGDGPSKGITLRRLKMTVGSTAEYGIRLHKVDGVLIEDCEITSTINKKSALRIHDGSNVTVRRGKYIGGVGGGPLAEGDGGRAIGITRWYLANGKTVDTEPNRPPAGVDFDRTDRERAASLARRMVNVLLEDVVVEGSLTAKAGLKNFTMRGGSVTPPAGKRIFEGTTEVYPEHDDWTLPGDIVRPPPEGKLVGVELPAGVNLNLPSKFKVFEGGRGCCDNCACDR